jgi:hypothetical protein
MEKLTGRIVLPDLEYVNYNVIEATFHSSISEM